MGCFSVFVFVFDQRGPTGFKRFHIVERTSLIKTEYAMAERRPAGRPRRINLVLNVFTLFLGRIQDLLAPGNVCKLPRRGREGKGLYLPAQIAISVRQDERRHMWTVTNLYHQKPAQRAPVPKGEEGTASASVIPGTERAA